MTATHPGVAAAILAGGQARRFGGQDKSRLVVGGRTIIVRQLEVLQQVAGDVFIVGPRDGRFADIGLAVHPDIVPGCGTIGGIHTALETARAGRVLVVACDLPFLHAGRWRGWPNWRSAMMRRGCGARAVRSRSWRATGARSAR